MINESDELLFQDTVWAYYQKHGRHDLPWRQAEVGGSYDPYKILVSEVMLQQTQVSRVVPKYQEFIAKLPDIKHVAAAPQSQIIKLWSGLGYNRRARFLHLTSKQIVQNNDGSIPATMQSLTSLPGIGPNTAGAIMAYAFNLPAVFIETNIRSVFMHHFFADQTAVSDTSILTKIQQTLDRTHPREWYWALVDYGVYLKQLVPNPSQRSKHYLKQSKFQGSKRQLRGQILRLLSDHAYSKDLLQTTLSDSRLTQVLSELHAEKLIKRSGNGYRL